jgi:apolipoprotein N-acyltransferase
MLDNIKEFFENKPKISSFLAGCIFNFAFPPFFIYPSLLMLSIFVYLILKSENKKDAFKIGWLFGFGFYLCNLYWISIGVSIYKEKFWWAIPFALVGLPIFLATYKALIAVIFYNFKDKEFKIIAFSSIWIIFEIIRSYLFSGFPWSLVAYSFADTITPIQVVSIIGIYSFGFFIIWSSSLFYHFFDNSLKKLALNILPLAIIWTSFFYIGNNRIENNHTKYTNIKFRIIQPNIEQSDKWTVDKFWNNFFIHKDLSLSNIENFNPDFIVWPEAAVTAEPTYVHVNNALKSVASESGALLITGGITDNLTIKDRSRDKLFASMYGIDSTGSLIFDYHKSHLVPFGEYIPFNINIDKITPGATQFSPGKKGFVVKLNSQKINIRPLLCYEIIFPEDVRMNNTNADIILNLTNDAYYGNSSGPYQHFYKAKFRAIENGLPVVRVANNGISGVIDPIGRILIKTKLNDRTFIDLYLPQKLTEPTHYSENNNIYFYILSFMSLGLAIFTQKHKN